MSTTSSIDIDFMYNNDPTLEILKCNKCNKIFTRTVGSKINICNICLTAVFKETDFNDTKKEENPICDCGAEKTYGKNCNTHSYWCSLNKK